MQNISWQRFFAATLLVSLFAAIGVALGLWFGGLAALGGAALGVAVGCYTVQWVIAGSGGDLFHYSGGG